MSGPALRRLPPSAQLTITGGDLGSVSDVMFGRLMPIPRCIVDESESNSERVVCRTTHNLDHEPGKAEASKMRFASARVWRPRMAPAAQL